MREKISDIAAARELFEGGGKNTDNAVVSCPAGGLRYRQGAFFFLRGQSGIYAYVKALCVGIYKGGRRSADNPDGVLSPPEKQDKRN